MIGQDNPTQKVACLIVRSVGHLPWITEYQTSILGRPLTSVSPTAYIIQGGDEMAYDLPTILDVPSKTTYFREQLYREISNLFEWEGLPEEIPLDYLERTLVRHGQVMFFYEPDTFGYMALRASNRYNNVYGRPTQAYSVSPNMENHTYYRERTIAYNYTPEDKLDKDKMCVLIQNMEGSQPISDIVDFYSRRMALVTQAFDTNALWQNVPLIFRVGDSSIKLSIEKLMGKIYSGNPFIITDKDMLVEGGGVEVTELKQEFKLDKLLDTINALKHEFLETIGINTPGADKKERLLTDEVNANNQSIETALSVMLEARKRACDEIKRLYPDLSPSVKVRGEVVENGSDNNGTPERDET